MDEPIKPVEPVIKCVCWVKDGVLKAFVNIKIVYDCKNTLNIYQPI